MTPQFLSHDPTVTEAIAAVEALLDAHRELPDGRASFNGAALTFVDLVADAVVERLQRAQSAQDVLTINRELLNEQKPLAS